MGKGARPQAACSGCAKNQVSTPKGISTDINHGTTPPIFWRGTFSSARLGGINTLALEWRRISRAITAGTAGSNSVPVVNSGERYPAQAYAALQRFMAGALSNYDQVVHRAARPR